ncbi:MAG: hypothetical protein IH598_00975, partial [Bacteroidales bacterium]|nr:hypothetical protein [Bacteroidales bacterium]
SVCESQTVSLSATAENDESVLWETEGDGIFSHPGSLSTTYTPGILDIAAGEVILSITAFSGNGCNNATSALSVAIEKSPTVDAGANQTICETDVVSLMATAGNNSSIHWTTDGDGTFSDATTLDPVYYPGEGDIAGGQLNLTITAAPISICNATEDQVLINIQTLPVAFAGEDVLVCKSDDFISLSGTASDYSAITWESNGDGWFEDPQSLGTVYHPGPGDLNSGNVVLCIKASGLYGCQPAEDCLEVLFQEIPIANAGDDAIICEGQNILLSGNAENYSLLQWVTYGDGYFDDFTLLNVLYTPGPTDVLMGTVQLCLNAEGLEGCQATTDCMLLTIQHLPVVEAGVDLVICSTDVVNLNASAANYAGLLWSTSGDGVFIGNDVLASQYIPGVMDIESGIVNLCVTVNGVSPCGNETDCLQVSIVPLPEAYAGEDATLFKTESYSTISATADNYSAVIWNTSGTGHFDDNTALSTFYHTSLQDRINKWVVLTLTALPSNPCQVSVSDEIHLTIEYPCLDAIANAGEDTTVCAGDNLHLVGASVFFSDTLTWSTSGDGTFDDISKIDPIYTPGSNDLFNGTVNLCLTAFGTHDCLDSEDCLTLFIQQPPSVYAGEDATVPFGSYPLANAWAKNYSAIQWITTNGMGYFTNDTIINTTYEPSYNDIYLDFVILKVICSPISPCSVFVDDEVEVKFYDGCLDAIANAGEDITACSAGGVPVDGFVEYAASVLWQTSGDGSFEDATTLETIYEPGTEDVANGYVNLSLTAFAFLDCLDYTDSLTLTLHQPPQVNAGVDQTICESELYVVLSNSASGQSSMLWTTSGDGFFIFDTVPSPYYYFGPQDKINGEVTLTLTAYSNLCPPVSDQVLIDITREPIVFSGDPAEICAGELFQTNEAFAVNYQQLFWSTSGDGYFDAQDQLNTTYHPGEMDVINGLAELCLKAFALSLCADDEHCFTLTFLPNATVSAGEDISVCESQTVSLSATAENDESVLWETEGDGIFSHPGSLSTTYTPGILDI